MTDLYLQSDGRDMTVWHDDKPLLTEHQAGPVLWAHLEATLPTRDEPQPEPLDPGVRVMSRGAVWARVSDCWVADGFGSEKWGLLSRHPLTIITPASKLTPDKRPFKIGDRVWVAADATWASGGITPALKRIRGGEAKVVDGSLAGPGNVAVGHDDGYTAHVAPRYLTHADAPC